MKIGIDVRCIGVNARGFERYTVNLLQALEKVGTHKYILISDRPFAKEQFGLGDRFEVASIPKKYHTLWWFNMQLSVWAKQRGLDVMHFTANEVWRNKPVPTTVTFHDAGTMLHPHAYAAGFKARFYFRMLKIWLPRADRIVTVSQASQRDIIEYLGCPAEQVTVTYEGIDPRFFAPASDDAIAAVRKDYALPERFALFLSALDRRKNIIGAVNGFRRAFAGEDCPLQLVVAGQTHAGKGARYLTPEMIRRETGCGDEVAFIGGIPSGQLPALYAAAEFLLLPSFYEGFGLPYIEAQACGTPVIAASTTSGPEIVGASGLLVDPDDDEMIATAVRRMATKGELRAALRQRGYENARRFRGEACAERLLKVWEEVCS